MPKKERPIKKTLPSNVRDGWSDTIKKIAGKKPKKQDIQGDELTGICIEYFGKSGWQARVSELMRLDKRTVKLWAKGVIPSHMAAELFRRMNRKDSRFEGSELKWPRDDWFITEGEEGRRYIIKHKSPRFQARILIAAADGGFDEDAIDMITGAVYIDDSIIICEVHWIDVAPPLLIQRKQLEEAAEKIKNWWDLMANGLHPK